MTLAAEIAARAYTDAYSAHRYGRAEFGSITVLLLERGYTEAETEGLLRSKLLRWAADAALASGDPDRATAGDVAAFLDNPRSRGSVQACVDAVREDLAAD